MEDGLFYLMEYFNNAVTKDFSELPNMYIDWDKDCGAEGKLWQHVALALEAGFWTGSLETDCI